MAAGNAWRVARLWKWRVVWLCKLCARRRAVGAGVARAEAWCDAGPLRRDGAGAGMVCEGVRVACRFR